MNTNENIPTYDLELQEGKTIVELIAPDGLGFGEGGISVKNQIETGILTEEVPRHIYELLMNDPEAFKPIEAADDGCGDGRPWHKIIRMVPDGNGGRKIESYNKSRLRAKVFGGGLVVASSMWRTISGAPENGETVGKDREFIAKELEARGFSHGAHSDDHTSGDNCGCGAIDNYPGITANTLKYRQEITGALEAIYGEDFEDNLGAIEATFKTYRALAGAESYFADADGKRSMEQILESGAVVKELSGRHIEETIVINDVRGTTLDQQYFTQEVKNASTEKPRIVQAFSVDIWRGREIADIVTGIVLEQHPDRDADEVRKLAYADFLIRTLAVAGTLTAGDLPVYRRRTLEKESLTAA